MENPKLIQNADIVVVGAGAAGLMATIFAARTAPNLKVVLLDGATRLGAKILAAGGGRCNVTHFEVTPEDYAGSSRNSIRKVLGHFEVKDTIDFFNKLGVELKREETGKLFPVTDKARSILDALLHASKEAGVIINFPRRVEKIKKQEDGFCLEGDWGLLKAQCVIIATGGRSLPNTGSDGHGYAMARALGHNITPHIFPSLVPLVLAENHFIRSLSGLTLKTKLEARSGTGKKIQAFTDSTLCTHFGLSGPCALNISRYLTAARFEDPSANLWINWLPNISPEQLDEQLRDLGAAMPLTLMRELFPERLAEALCLAAEIDPRTPGNRFSRKDRQSLVKAVMDMPLPIIGDKGFGIAEVTAGGVPLSEIHLNSMESRVCPGLFICGEICDVDGRIGGFNFQWAWASGFIAGRSAAQGLVKVQ